MQTARCKLACDPNWIAFRGMRLTLLICILLTGCSPPIDQCRDLAVTSEQASRRAWEANDPKTARKAFNTADRASSTLEKAVKAAPEGPAREILKQQLVEAQVAARGAQKYAETAEQEHERQERLSGFKA